MAEGDGSGKRCLPPAAAYSGACAVGARQSELSKLLSEAGAGAARLLRRSALGACALLSPTPPHCVSWGGACAVPCPALSVSRYVQGITLEPLPEGHRPERPAPAPRGCRLSEHRRYHR